MTFRIAAAAFVSAVLVATGVSAQQVRSINSYGVSGLIDLPSAQMQPDAELTTSVTILSNRSGRGQIAFQLLPRVQAVFRYATLPNFLPDGSPQLSRTYDRSFDLRLQLLKERHNLPSVVLGLQDLGGTSIYAAEYIVATKSFGDFTVTGGIGWGRLGTRGGFSNPLSAISDRFDSRPNLVIGTGGTLQSSQLFRGDAALFGGVQYEWSDRLTLKAEYSSDAYVEEVQKGVIDIKTPLNFGLDYALRPGLRVGGHLLHGSEVGLTLQFALNLKKGAFGSGIDPQARPVTLRPARDLNPRVWDTAWTQDGITAPVARANLVADLGGEDLEVVATKIEGDRAEIHFRNGRFTTSAQAIGRAARHATAALPASVETIVLVPLNDLGIAGTAVVLRRSDLEALENAPDGTDEVLAVAGMIDAATLDRTGLFTEPDAFPRFRWSLGPYVSLSAFDPDNPARFDLGAQAYAAYEPVQGLLFEGAVRRRLVGNRDESTRTSISQLARVRTDSNLFAKTDGPFISHATANYLWRPGRNLYARVSGGLLEQQYGGVSGELLWKRERAPLAIGLEVNRVRQRDFDMRFGFQDLDATTAFVTGYLNHGNGFHSKLDVGQYLAGDKGATYELTREFSNGWSVSAYATKTNITSEQFGEGSFDRGIRIGVPFSWILGTQTQASSKLLIQPILRDGGARLNLGNRLYPMVRDQSSPKLTENWGRFWR
ncbi:Exopolysaccharide biosynthesis protein YbjH [Jannaschia faecimaris]|uniref:Exopolysaccharide biosynthesis protein YbjH n=1 Tax=Jannaschia faecimaris TaxID=1244108 RepID=A0A1H3IRS8_9RHOB|nr:YjbH domain-containing protein [Jannaschia faecimaris]SDY30025.1 Exopolysaccharide biosynthesis protein YbjH [Jannaschia faecimaris]